MIDVKITSYVNVRPKQYFYVQKCEVIYWINFFFKNTILYERNMREKKIQIRLI